MKYIISSLLCFLISAFTYGQVQYLTIEGNHSTIGFVVDIAGGVTKVTGKFMDFDLLAYISKITTRISAILRNFILFLTPKTLRKTTDSPSTDNRCFGVD